ncbi:shikimate kinase [Salibaculum griseiflavum]|uniref:shikimate kinase n=1 Tax=Salibaculum griseiflavum TaxID=1914409 RepID=UPI0022A7E22D|nr:shikimate kinase [Salibaculum griseiflavum]
MVTGKAQDRREKTGAVLHRTVVLVGMMGSGKSAIGRNLAARLGVAFLDSDAEIEAAANASIAEIFARDGEAFFRDREAEVIARLLKSEPCILSTGGGAFLAERNRRAIAQHGVALWLDADLDLLWDRVRHKDTRPLLRTPDPRGTLARIFEDRAPIYAKAGLRTKAEPEYSIDDMTDRVIETLAADPRILELADDD